MEQEKRLRDRKLSVCRRFWSLVRRCARLSGVGIGFAFILTMGDLYFQPTAKAANVSLGNTNLNTKSDFSSVFRKLHARHWLQALLVVLVLMSAASVHAYTYYYTGVSETAKVAYASQARLRMDAHPKCLRGKCHAIAWTVLWDPGKGRSNQYVEAGIGYSPRACPTNTPVKLWWASPQKPSGVNVGCVRKGTEVVVTVQREDGHEGVLATWEWNDKRISQWVETPGWTEGPGIHPTKIEIYSHYDSVTPGPVSLSVSDVLMFEQDTKAFLHQTAPYYAVPGSSLTSFAVNY
ncbi:MAG: hypothetical protein FJ147_15810 [Deltaproteobacteria bacterium]|nr:hypothetical protein [Deltaproteobacteria bacterium]